MQVMDDVNIIICCKLREHVIPGIDRTVSAELTGAEFIKLCGRNTRQKQKSVRRDMRTVITNFHARLSANILEER